MKKIFSFLLLGLLLSIGNAWAETLTVDFESAASAYTDWTINNYATQQTNANVPAHGGNYFGSTNGKTSGSIVTNSVIASPQNITFYISKQSTNTTASSWLIKVSSDGETWTQIGGAQSASAGITRGEWTEVSRDLTSYANVYVGIFYDGTTAVRCIDDIVLTYSESGGGQQAATTTIIIDDSGITNTDVYTSTEAGSLSATVKAGEDDIQGAVVTWSGNNDAVATIDANGAVTLVAEGTVTFTAAYAGVEDEYQASSKTYQMTVTNSDPNAPGTENNPFSVTQAIAATPASGTRSNVYIHGIVSSFYNTSIVGDGNNYRYYISDDGTTTNQLLIFKGKGLNNVAFSNVNDLLVGDEITIVGGLTMYQSAPEVAANNYIVSLDRPAAAPVINANNVNIAYDATSGEIAYTISNATEATLTAATSTDWISNINVTADKVTFTTTANTGDLAREGFITLSYTGAEDKVVTILQAKLAHAGTAEDPFTVDEVIDGTATGSNVYVRGYIVGEYVGNSTNPKTASFSGNSNLALSFSFSTSPNVDNCIPVELPSNPASIRTNWGLKNTNGAKVGYEVIVLANCTTYFSTNGVKGTSQITPVSMDITIGSTGYATYYNSTEAYFMPEGCTGYGFTFENGLETLAAYVPGEDVPANEPLVIVGTPGVKTLEFTTSIVDPIAAIGANDLLGTDTETTLTADADYYFYGLSLNSASEANSIGFYWMAEGGAAFTNGAHKAYLKLAKTLFADPNQAPSRILFNENNATSIQNVKDNEKVMKFIENGILYILREGVVYDAMGKTVR